jgi:hypothetical protein
MTKDEIGLQYWRFSQHFTALRTTADREAFLNAIISPALEKAYHPLQQKLLLRLLARPVAVAA